MPRCANNALSTLRTVCFGFTSALVSKCTSLTAPLSLATIRAANTPGSVTNSSSARRSGKTVPAIGDTGCDDGVGALSGTDTRNLTWRTRENEVRRVRTETNTAPSLRPGGEVTARFTSECGQTIFLQQCLNASESYATDTRAGYTPLTFCRASARRCPTCLRLFFGCPASPEAQTRSPHARSPPCSCPAGC